MPSTTTITLCCIALLAAIATASPVPEDTRPGSKWCSRNPSVATKATSPPQIRLRGERLRAFFKRMEFPSSISVLNNPSSLLDLVDSSLHARIAPYTHYDTFDDVVAYFFGPTSGPAVHTTSMSVVKLDASDSGVATIVDMNLCPYPFTACDASVPFGPGNIRMRSMIFVMFNCNDKIISMESSIVYSGAAFDHFPTPELQAARVAQVCQAFTMQHFDPRSQTLKASGTCTSNFDSDDDFPTGFVREATPFLSCVKWLSSLPFGTWDAVATNTVVCRIEHSYITPLNSRYCDWIKPVDPVVCKPFNYAEYFQHEY